jgi:hypothetical protein
MGWRLVNQTPHLLIVPLNSGKSIHLAPNETSPFLEHAQINGNAKVEKLIARKSIRLVQEKTQETAPVAPLEARRKALGPAEGAPKSKREKEPERGRKTRRERKKK